MVFWNVVAASQTTWCQIPGNMLRIVFLLFTFFRTQPIMSSPSRTSHHVEDGSHTPHHEESGSQTPQHRTETPAQQTESQTTTPRRQGTSGRRTPARRQVRVTSLNVVTRI